MARSPIFIAVAAAILFFSSFACAPKNRGFTPAHTALAPSPKGYRAAIYEVLTDRGDWGRVRVWSRGFEDPTLKWDVNRSSAAVKIKTDWKRPRVHAGFIVTNESSVALKLRLDETHVELFLSPDGSLTLTESAVTRDHVAVPQNSERRINLYFPLPHDFPVEQVTAYRVSWVLENRGKRYAQSTSFARNIMTEDPGFGPYDPYYGFPRGDQEPAWPYARPGDLQFEVLNE